MLSVFIQLDKPPINLNNFDNDPTPSVTQPNDRKIRVHVWYTAARVYQPPPALLALCVSLEAERYGSSTTAVSDQTRPLDHPLDHLVNQETILLAPNTPELQSQDDS